MATISFRDFSQGQPVKTIGDEGKVQTQEQNGGAKLFSQLAERAKTFGKEALTLGTLGASTMTPQDFNATGQDRSLAAVEGLSKAGLAPWNMVGAVGGAIGDVVGAGLQATGLDKPIGEALAPVAQSEVAQKAVQAFQSLPQEYQDYLKTGLDVSNLVGLGIGKKTVATGLEKAGQVAKDTISPLANKVLPKLTPDAEQIMQRVARVSKGKQANFEARAGESIGSYLDKRGIYGNVDQITEQLYNRFQQSKTTADNALASLQGNYQPTVIKTALTELQKKLTRVSSEGATDPNLGKVNGLLAKFDNQGLTMSEINEAKRLYERNVKLDFLKENNPEGITTANNIDNAIRSWQFKQAEKLGLKNLPEINKETMLAKQLLDDLGKEYAGSAGNNMITLTDWIVLSGGDPTAVAGFLTKQGLSSKKVQSFIAKLISKNQPKKGQVTPQVGESTVLPIGTYKDFLKETSKTSKPTTQPQVEKGLKPSSNTVPPKEGVVNELINNPLRGSVTPSEFLPKKKVVSEPVTLYHGTNADFKEFKIKDKKGGELSGIYLTPDPKVASGYGNIKEVTVTGKILNVKDYNDLAKKLGFNTYTKEIKTKIPLMVKDMGYDGIKVANGAEKNEIIVFNTNAVKIKPSLSPLEQEAKKYKSAEEFVKAAKGSATQYGEYNPKLRANIPAGYQNITELGIDPEEMVTVYRGIDDISGKVKRKINDGDFVTTDFDSALSYTGNPKDVVEMQVPAKTLYNSEPRDFKEEPFYTGAEYIYTTKSTKSLPTDKELTDIWKKANKNLPEIVKNKNIGDVEIFEGKPTVGDKKGFGLAKIKSDHPEVLPYIEEAFKTAKVVEVLPDRKILEGTSGDKIIRFIVDSKLGKENKTFLNNAYFLKN